MLVDWDSHDPVTRTHNHRVAPTAATQKVNQIGRFFFNSAKHKNSTGFQNVILSTIWCYLLVDTWHVQGMINEFCCTASTQKRAPLTTSHGRLRWLMCSNSGLLAGALSHVMSTPTTRTLHRNVLPFLINDLSVSNVYAESTFTITEKSYLLWSQSAVMFSLPLQKSQWHTTEYHSVSFCTTGPFNDVWITLSGTLSGNVK